LVANGCGTRERFVVSRSFSLVNKSERRADMLPLGAEKNECVVVACEILERMFVWLYNCFISTLCCVYECTEFLNYLIIIFELYTYINYRFINFEKKYCNKFMINVNIVKSSSQVRRVLYHKCFSSFAVLIWKPISSSIIYHVHRKCGAFY